MAFWDERVLFLDGEALVIDKPAGLPVDRPRAGGPSVESRIDELKCGFQRPPVAMHRLDQDTSGCLLLARNPKAHKRFQRAFEARQVTKAYLAVLDGVPAAESGTVDLALDKVSTAEAGWRMVPDPVGRAAVSHWRVAGVHEGRALVLFTPETGRTHQLRVHASAGIGIPIAGDPVYGRGKGPMLLHALSLRLDRGDKPPVEATAPLPPTFLGAGFGGIDLETTDAL